MISVDPIHESPRKGVFVFAGGGTLMLSDMMTVPGASATVLEAAVPYSQDALAEWLACVPDKFCDEDTAILMALTAYGRALEFGGDFGFAVTASLRTTRPKRGGERAWMAFGDKNGGDAVQILFDKTRDDRPTQERMLAEEAKGMLIARI